MTPRDPLDLFLPPVRHWFRAALGEPTAAQRGGWPCIAAGQHTLILAPTGSGKTLAAFLACLDYLWRQDPWPRGVQVLYISPLKALNNDIHRNLQVPLAGVAETAQQLGQPLPTITTAVRTGDTPSHQRQRLIHQPPQVLITTPESLHLLLTSRARDTLRTVTHCIIDEIHALCANKRGVFLSLLLERLQALNPRGFTRIGLSATQRPLEEVARYLGGSAWSDDQQLQPRPVTIIDAGLRKDLDLQVVSPVDQFGPLPERSIWPSIYRLLTDYIGQHRSTIIFANNRRTVERITAQLNEQWAVGSGPSAVGRRQETESGGESEHGASIESPLTTDPLLLTPHCPLPIALAHHGSVSLEVRQQTEQALKDGRLPAVVATASLELGIDMGAVELVCQVESPGSIARGLQRVGRAGHLVGRKSKGRLIPKTSADLLEQAVLAHEMAAGRVEDIRVPMNCLDVLAQQVVAAVAMDAWDVPTLYALVRQAYPYRDLTPQAFETVLEMVSGRYRLTQEVGSEQWAVGSEQPEDNVPTTRLRQRSSLTALQPRVSWDRVHNRLLPLPGTRHLALVNGGTIPDTGQYAAYLRNGTRIGELDEEFVYERRVGDVFLLGTNAWRIDQIEADRVIILPAEGAPALVPFWRGEGGGRSYDLGMALGRFLRELEERLLQQDCLSWLRAEFMLDAKAARNVLEYVRRQLEIAGLLPTDETILVEASRDPLGDWQVIILSPRGSRVHLSLRLALEARLRQRLGYLPQCLHHDDGILIRVADTAEPVLDVFDGLTPDNVEQWVLEELADSALFALRFRQNAARAMLFPRGQAGQRAPLWLQRLRGKDLLQVARRHPDFPVLVETFRECLHDHLDLPRLRQLLADIHGGKVTVRTRRTDAPSPFASGLLFAFTAANMYQYDDVEPDSHSPSLDWQLLEQLITPRGQKHLLDPRAVQQVDRRLRGLGLPPRTATEMAEWLRKLGDVRDSELEGPMLGFLQELVADGRVQRIELPGMAEPLRWVLTEEVATYRQAFGLEEVSPAQAHAAGDMILQRFLQTHALVGLRDVLERYPFDAAWSQGRLEEWTERGRLVTVPATVAGESLQWSAPENLDQVRRGSLGLLRREVLSCSPAQLVDFVMRWQQLHPATRHGTAQGLTEVLGCLQGLPLPAELWEQWVLPARVPSYQPRWLDECGAGGVWTWICHSTSNAGAGVLAFWQREQLPRLPAPAEPENLDDAAQRVRECLQQRGAAFVADLASWTRLTPGVVRVALWHLLRRRLVTNDHFDVIRKGEPAADALPIPGTGQQQRGGLLRLPRRSPRQSNEGRWSLVPWGRATVEDQAVFLASVLLRRYGVVARELALLDPWLPPWRVLYEVLSRMELAGEVRRGYFVEGLSGVQFALPEAAQQLSDLTLPATAAAPLVLLHSLDPANLYGAGAPFPLDVSTEDPRPLTRRAGNWLVLRAGRPLLIIEQQGKRLTSLPGVQRDELAAAVACLPLILDYDQSLAARRKLTVATWNNQPVITSVGRELLEAAGFVRDYQGMTLYAAWR
ncbi:MAG: DEAD/DEAH box helicase [Gemmataceae bacterium]